MSGSEAFDGRDWRGPALAAASWAGMWSGTSGSVELGVAGAVLAGLAAGWGWWRSRWLVVAAALALLAALGIGGLRAWVAGQGPVVDWAQQGAVVSAELRLSGGRVSAGGAGGPIWIATATLVAVEGRGQHWASGATVRLTASGGVLSAWAAVPAGAVVRTVVRLSPAAIDESVSAWARTRAAPTVLVPPGAVDVAVNTVRSGLRDAVSGLPAGPRALVPALVVGDTDGMPGELTEQFRVTGLTHLMAVSGANLTLLLAALLWAAARLGVMGWWRRGLALVGVIAFVLLCRAEPSVVRAAAMGLVGLAALGWGGARQGLRYLSWAVVGLLLIDPWLCRSLGFVLSVCASAGIILWAKRWAEALSVWLPSWLAEAITVPVAAQLATQPVVTAISGQVSLVGVAANLIAAPLVGPGTVLGFLAAGLSVIIPPLAAVMGWLAGGFAQALCWVAEAGSALPGAAIGWPASPPAVALLAVACVALAAGLPLLWPRPWLVIGLVVCLVLLLLRPPSVPGWPPQDWQVVQCDVGQGAATVVAVAPRAAIVIDTGPDPRSLERCLAELGIERIPLLVLTHFHADHAGGVSALANREVEAVLTSAVAQPPEAGEALSVATGEAARLNAAPGMVVAVGTTRIEVISALATEAEPAQAERESSAENDASVVVRIDTGRSTVLATGDIETAGQNAVLRSGASLAADVLIVPHHGSARQSAELFDAVGAPVALIGVGEDNDYGHPSQAALRLLDEAGSTVYRTDLHGAIAVARDGDQLVVTTQRSG